MLLVDKITDAKTTKKESQYAYYKKQTFEIDWEILLQKIVRFYEKWVSRMTFWKWKS